MFLTPLVICKCVPTLQVELILKVKSENYLETKCLLFSKSQSGQAHFYDLRELSAFIQNQRGVSAIFPTSYCMILVEQVTVKIEENKRENSERINGQWLGGGMAWKKVPRWIATVFC